jgi:hypothetical protein
VSEALPRTTVHRVSLANTRRHASTWSSRSAKRASRASGPAIFTSAEGESQGLPVWSRHVGDPILESNITRRVDFALFMVEALENDELIYEAPAIVGRLTPSALAHAGSD